MKINQLRLTFTSIALTLSWLFALLGLIVYIQNLNQYFFVSRSLFIFPNFFWNILDTLKISIDTSIRLMLWGTSFFVFLFVDFTINYTSFIKKQNRYLLELVLIVWFVFVSLIYDPVLYERIYYSFLSVNSTHLNFEQFYNLQAVFHFTTSFVNILLIFASITILLRFYIRNRKYIYFNRPLKRTVISLIIIVIVYLMLFTGAPYFLKTVSLLSQTIRYQRINLGVFDSLYSFIPYIMLFTLLFTFYIVFDQRRFVIENENKDLKILRDVSVANSSSRIFTHSVKNQLVAILADTEQLLETLDKNNVSYKLAHSIKESTQHTIQHVNDLRHFMDNLVVELKPTHLDAFIQSLNFNKLFSKEIAYIPYFESESICLIDAQLMQEALLVIIKNAIDAMSQNKGTIRINTKDTDKFAIIEICDTGCGIDKKDIEKIFDPFFSTKPSRTNWGVGLTFSQKIVMAHHGRIQVESKLNSGTCFSIYLPIIE